MSESRLPYVRQPVTSLPRGTDRDQRVSRSEENVVRSRPSRLLRIEAHRRPTSPRGGGRAWINGREVGGSDPRYAHLAGPYD